MKNTKSVSADSDGDSLSDWEEVKVWMTEPLIKNPFPFCGFTWHFSWGWVDGSSIGDSSNNYNVDYKFQTIWDEYFKPTHGRTIRCDINVMAAVSNDYTTVDQTTLNKVTNLCLWAKENNAQMYFVLKGAGNWDLVWDWWSLSYIQDPNCHKDIWYINKVGVFVKELATKVFTADPSGIAYKHIVAYQVENEMNHGSHHKDWNENWEINLMAGGSEAIRNAEIEANVLTYAGRYTPLAFNPSYDWIVNMGDLFVDNYQELKQYIKSVLDDSRSKIDVIGLDYYPRTWVSGVTEEDVVVQVKSLCNDFGLQSSYKKYIMVTETGYSTQSPHSNNDQKNYYRSLTASLTNFYHDNGKQEGFIGVVWYELLSRDEEWLPPHEDYFGIMKKNDDGTVNYCKDAWYWLTETFEA